ncbi:MAG TPA: hypothetical protein VGA96_04985 [Fibrella sp.]
MVGFYPHAASTRHGDSLLTQHGKKMATKKAVTLITSTIVTLDNGIDSAKPKDGLTLINEWIDVVKTDESVGSVADELQELYDRLSQQQPDKKRIAQLIKKLGDETAKAARKADNQYQGSLRDLGESLKDFANELK